MKKTVYCYKKNKKNPYSNTMINHNNIYITFLDIYANQFYLFVKSV